ncbi:MAG: Hpt domain-containing protein [Nitrospinota bacterium]|nr:Hpt domain-containing protein [Nitrospinota bacterium]
MTESDMKHGGPDPARIVSIEETNRGSIPRGNEKSESEKPLASDAIGMGMEEYLDDFLSEFGQALVAMNSSLDTLESDPADKMEINNLYRNSHNMKGGSNAMGLMRLGAVFLNIESVIEPYRSGLQPFSGKVAGAIRVSLASLEKVPASVQRMKSDNALDLDVVSAALFSSLGGHSPVVD